MDFVGWLGDDIGGIVLCGDLFLNFHDIVLDINSKQRKGTILKWYYENIEGISSIEDAKNSINYYSYTKGLRVADLKKTA